MTAPWVTLTVFDALPPAEIVRGRLRVEGIACALVDRSLLQLGIVAGGIELQVPASQLEQARAVLAQDFSGELELEP
jgi:Putative prokaryotic signal transducing protein